MPGEIRSSPQTPQITLCHGAADAAFAARLARDLLNMYGEESVRLAGPEEFGDGTAAAPDAALAGMARVFVVVLSPEALASGELNAALRSAAPATAGDARNATMIALIARDCTLPTWLSGHRRISFTEAWRYDLALAELLDAIRLASDGATPVAVPLIPPAAAQREHAPRPQPANPPAFVPRIFISHSSADNAFGLEVERRLKNALGDPDAVFYDSDGGLHASDEWLKRLQHEITKRNVFVLLLSPEAFASPWVDQELSLALRQAVSVGSKVIIPVIHRETTVWPFLGNFQFVDFARAASFDAAFDELLYAVRLGESRRRDIAGMRQERLGPPFDVDLLPIPERFVGREADLDWALQRLTPGTRDGTGVSGLASIAAANGLAGIGKSALAGQVARILYATNRFPDGIAVVLCNGLADPAVVLRQVLARFDPQGREPEELEPQQLRDLARQVFGGRRALVVLDNVEPGWPVEQVVQPLRVAGAAVLLTSRQRLPASAVHTEASRMLELLSPEEAQDLFAEYYGRGTRLDLTSTEQGQVARIVKALGHHTLAVKLAAARAQGQNRDLETLAKSYEADPRLGVHLKDGAEAVAVVLAASVASLPERARTLFAALGAFATGDLGRRAALAVASSLEDPDPEASLDAIVDLRLVDAYVAAELPPEADRERLRLHPLVRAYACELLDGAGPDKGEAAYRAVAVWYADYANEAPYLALIPDEANIVGALEWAPEHIAGGNHGDLVIARICHGMRGFWRDTGRTRAGLRYLPWGQAAAERVAKQTGTREDQLRAASITLYYGDILQNTGRLDEAEAIYRRNLALRQELDDRQGEGVVLSNLGRIALARGRLEEAAEFFTQGLAVLRQELDDRQGEGVDLSSLGQIALRRGRLEEAAEFFTASLAIDREVGDRQGEGVVLSHLGQIALRRGRLEEAAEYFTASLAIRREVGDRQGEGVDLSLLGQLALARGRLEEAAEFFTQGLAVLREVGDRRGEGVDLSNLGQLALARGRLEEAAEFFTASLAIDREVGDRQGEGVDLAYLATIATALQQDDEAEDYYRQALALAEDVQDAPNYANIGVALAEFLITRRGKRDEGCQMLAEAARLYDQMGVPGAEQVRETARRLGCIEE